jgi:hypothetical protein
MIIARCRWSKLHIAIYYCYSPIHGMNGPGLRAYRATPRSAARSVSRIIPESGVIVQKMMYALDKKWKLGRVPNSCSRPIQS